MKKKGLPFMSTKDNLGIFVDKPSLVFTNEQDYFMEGKYDDSKFCFSIYALLQSINMLQYMQS